VRRELAEQGIAEDGMTTRTKLHLRYDGTDTTLDVAFDGDLDAVRAGFEEMHKAQFGFITPDKPITVEAVEVEGAEIADAAAAEAKSACRKPKATDTTRRIFSGGEWREAGIFRREGLAPGNRVKGPALIIEANQTIVIEPGWTARITEADHVVLSRHEKMQRSQAIGTKQADPILLEVFNNLFMNIAEQMGVALQNTAIRSTSRSGSTSPAPSSTPTARWSPTRRTCRCIWAPWTARWKPSSASTRARSAPATSSRSTPPIMAARICPTSPW
jgi:5-oxoprolinase (ATP-hydrolysing)